jgi:hypothetical protein
MKPSHSAFACHNGRLNNAFSTRKKDIIPGFLFFISNYYCATNEEFIPLYALLIPSDFNENKVI